MGVFVSFPCFASWPVFVLYFSLPLSQSGQTQQGLQQRDNSPATLQELDYLAVGRDGGGHNSSHVPPNGLPTCIQVLGRDTCIHARVSRVFSRQETTTSSPVRFCNDGPRHYWWRRRVDVGGRRCGYIQQLGYKRMIHTAGGIAWE